MTDRDDEIRREAEKKIAARRASFAKPPGLASHVGGGGLDPESWPLAICPDCDSSPRKVPPAFLHRAQIERDDENPPSIRCDECRALASEREVERLAEAKRSAVAAEIDLRRRRLPELLAKAGSPPVYARLSRQTWERSYGRWEDHRKYREFIGWPGGDFDLFDGDQIICLYGKYGRRKTGFATAILGECIVAGLDCRWEDTATWLREMKAGSFADEDAVWRRASTAGVLLLDDFGAVVGSRGVQRESWDLEKLAEISRYRHMQGLPTIYTTNGSLDDLGAIDGSLASRFSTRLSFEMGGRDRRVNP